MKYLRQFGILLAVTFAGEILNYALPLPIPASVYGIILLFVLLLTGVVKKEWIKDVTAWLIGIMPILFVAPTVGLLDAWGVLQPVVVPYDAVFALIKRLDDLIDKDISPEVNEEAMTVLKAVTASLVYPVKEGGGVLLPPLDYGRSKTG